MKKFEFQQFIISQSPNVFRVGTDGVLLGALASVEGVTKILEIGTGTGLVSLMLAQRQPDAEIIAIDISEDAVAISKENFKNSKFKDRIEVIHQDFKNYETEKRFDLIICNPPFFELNSSVKDIVARQKIELDFLELIRKSAKLLSDKGRFAVIIPSDSADNFIQQAKEYQLFLVNKINIYGIENGTLRRNILEFSNNNNLPLQVSNFVIEKSPRKYSDQYLELTKEFHVFKK